MCCHVWSIWDDDFTDGSELKTTNGKTKITVESQAGRFTDIKHQVFLLYIKTKSTV